MQEAKAQLFLYTTQGLALPAFKETAESAACFETLHVFKQPDRLLQEITRPTNQKHYTLIISPYLHADLRLLIHQLQQRHRQAVGLCSLRELAYTAWRLECFDFLALPVNRNELARSFQKFRKEILQLKAPPLIFKYQGGHHLLEAENILYCKGAGNYTQVQLNNGSKILLTLKIGDMEKKLQSYETLYRVGRSFIINILSIQAIKKNEVIFKSQKPHSIKLGKGYLQKLKQILLGINH